ncbi:hypothetical protein [Actinoplanes awajinensis]|uniref:Ricin B lectin domain-containing protein n=1 Tax=Actinoplanes awajinensis subsp. mycoplanecinus TaxID=135947 RepID=A0A101J9Q5_9ACTN|nr:hypothetical protein [Actinoplanes awajinensis]KUL22746.1 hypothetical protein ADL15_47660 [Actinoplanes awajinensis subsp. mycoplanecinus]
MRTTLVGAFALAGVAALTGCGAGTTPASDAATAPSSVPVAVVESSPATTATPKAARTTAAPSAKATAKPKAVVSDVSQLKKLGITLNAGVLIDVADDGVDRYLAIGKNGVVDFTGTTRTDNTMMALKPAPVAQKNRVVIKPPFYNEDLGAGSCVADTAGAALKLETCKTGAAAQIWTVVPAGDSGQFELQGKFGILRVENGKLTTGGTGRTGLQTIKYAK